MVQMAMSVLKKKKPREVKVSLDQVIIDYDLLNLSLKSLYHCKILSRNEFLEKVDQLKQRYGKIR